MTHMVIPALIKSLHHGSFVTKAHVVIIRHILYITPLEKRGRKLTAISLATEEHNGGVSFLLSAP